MGLYFLRDASYTFIVVDNTTGNIFIHLIIIYKKDKNEYMKPKSSGL